MGKPSLHVSAVMSSESAERGVPVADFETYTVAAAAPVLSRLTLLGQYQLRDRDSLRYAIQAGVRAYSRDPASDLAESNPDGPVRSAVVTVKAGFRYTTRSGPTTRAVGDLTVAVPLSRHLTLGAGYRFYEETEPVEVVSGYGLAAFYFGAYRPDSNYVNPDGPVGQPVIKLFGSGTSKGIVGQAEVLVPLTRGLSLSAVFRLERLASPVRKALSAGAAAAYYFGP